MQSQVLHRTYLRPINELESKMMSHATSLSLSPASLPLFVRSSVYRPVGWLSNSSLTQAMASLSDHLCVQPPLPLPVCVCVCCFGGFVLGHNGPPVHGRKRLRTAPRFQSQTLGFGPATVASPSWGPKICTDVQRCVWVNVTSVPFGPVENQQQVDPLWTVMIMPGKLVIGRQTLSPRLTFHPPLYVLDCDIHLGPPMMP
ncbi:hypothetical protein ECG_05645 [Echinococcus granulosus]|nr:hypothetical protein ECG_05645 [Echinococcus granulosus]